MSKARLENWRIIRLKFGMCATGEIYGDENKRFRDGTFISTSHIIDENLTNNEITTKTGTKYTLGKPAEEDGEA